MERIQGWVIIIHTLGIVAKLLLLYPDQYFMVGGKMKYMFKFLLAVCLLSCANGAIATQPGSDKSQEYKMPAYKKSFVVSPEVYKKAVDYHTTHYNKLSNPNKFVIIDFSLHASKARLLYLDIANETFRTHHVAAGVGSDADGDGYATKFSNTADSKMSSLGAYVTLHPYTGKYGYFKDISEKDTT
ncbi:hypothetical protein C4J81_01820 [Deltaproteobacteria bacterium Smac51]|nr:hypothetical protein C4J81_01820 [Deltaproteobacteria bacterium Smac51]